jgi:hypothetical protein
LIVGARAGPPKPGGPRVSSIHPSISSHAPARALLLGGALLAAACIGIGIGIGAGIWEGSSAPPAPSAAPSAAPSNATSWLYVATAASGVVTATGGDTLTLLMRDAAPEALAFTDRPARAARTMKTATVYAGLYADGSKPPNGAISFMYDGDAVVLPIEMLNVTAAGPDYTVAARALGTGGVEVLGAAMLANGTAVVRGAGHPLWAALEAGLEVAEPKLFIDNGGSCYVDGCDCSWGGCQKLYPSECCQNCSGC